MQEMCAWLLGLEDTLKEEMAMHSNILAWKIPWTEEPGRLQSMELQRVGHDWAEIVNNWPSGTFQMQTSQYHPPLD